MYSATGLPPWQSNSSYGHANGHPAYISVPTRNPYASSVSLPPPPTYVPQPLHQSVSPSFLPPKTATSPPPNDQKKKTEWPPTVREYVNRAFAVEYQIPGVEKPDLEQRLREVITNAAKMNMLHTYNWDTMLLPQQMIAEDRRRAALGFQSVPPNFVSPLPPPIPSSLFPGPSTSQSSHSGLEARKKRKSSELSVEIDNNPQTHPPWRSKKGASLEDRISAPDKRQKFDKGPMLSKSNISLEQRRKRFDDGRPDPSSPRKHEPPPAPAEPVGPVVGRSQKLEKNYFRLTSAPNPDEVRPLPILRQTLDLLKKKWKQDSNYGYICDQFKSLRQDLTVQHIKNDFTTNVYEIHARIALEKGDLGEYNQCQTQLRGLYRQHLGGHPTEFKAYRILYFLHTRNRTDMNDVLSELTPAEKESKEVKHALAVRSALALGNYHQFFKLYLDPPNMGAYLMDMFIERERINALAFISRAYKPATRLRFITEELGFESDEEAAQFVVDHDGKDFLEEKGDYVQVKSHAGHWEDLKKSAFSSVDIKGQI